MKSDVLVNKLIDIAQNVPTHYGLGMWGQVITPEIIIAKARQLPSFYTEKKRRELEGVCDGKTVGFDCVCLIKSVLWGWIGDLRKKNCGAVYASGNVPDVNADGMIARCAGVTSDFSGESAPVPGEALWKSGHIGIYIGEGLAVECTPQWKNCVQITGVSGMEHEGGYPERKWTKHGRLPWVTYSDEGAYLPECVSKKTYEDYVVKHGDTLWGIAKERLGDGKKYKEIKKANGLITDVIKVGQVLKIPK